MLIPVCIIKYADLYLTKLTYIAILLMYSYCTLAHTPTPYIGVMGPCFASYHVGIYLIYLASIDSRSYLERLIIRPIMGNSVTLFIVGLLPDMYHCRLLRNVMEPIMTDYMCSFMQYALIKKQYAKLQH